MSLLIASAKLKTNGESSMNLDHNVLCARLESGAYRSSREKTGLSEPNAAQLNLSELKQLPKETERGKRTS
jgi:hypothetical protein